MSTDPALNLDTVLGTALGNGPVPVSGVPNLEAMNINPAQAAIEYGERTVAPYRGLLPDSEITLLEERLSGACIRIEPFAWVINASLAAAHPSDPSCGPGQWRK